MTKPAESEGKLLEAAREAGMYPRNLVYVVKEFLRGGSYADVAYRIGVSKNTVMKIAKLAEKLEISRLCECGRPSGHRGKCGPRLEKSLYGGRYRRAEKPPYLVLIERATAAIRHIEMRDEIRNDLVVAFLSGALEEEHFTTEAERLRRDLSNEKYRSVSLNDPVGEDVTATFQDLLTEESRADAFQHEWHPPMKRWRKR